MGMFSLSDSEKFNLALELGYLKICFGDNESVSESIVVKQKCGELVIRIRNRKEDGASSKDIPHPTPTIKVEKNNEFRHDGKRGLPITIDTMELYKSANKKENLDKLSKNDWKYIKKIIKDNKEDILRYWECDPETEKSEMKEIQDRINNKYN